VDPHSVATVADAIDAARPAYDELVALAEDVEDEWTYVNDLSAAWIARLDEVSARRDGDPAPSGVGQAVAALAREAAAIDDAHRAIDWLSTYPQVLLIAVGERP
jgi:hypothetical protein